MEGRPDPAIIVAAFDLDWLAPVREDHAARGISHGESPALHGKRRRDAERGLFALLVRRGEGRALPADAGARATTCGEGGSGHLLAGAALVRYQLVR